MKLFKLGWFNFSFKPTGKTTDRIRIAQINAAKNTKLNKWVHLAQKHLHSIGFKKMEVDVIITGDIDYSDLAIAYLDYDKEEKYIHLNNNILSRKDEQEAINTLIHEWAHIWLFNRIDNKVIFEQLQDKIKELRLTNFQNDPALVYALDYERGDELFVYLVVYYHKLKVELQMFLDNLIK